MRTKLIIVLLLSCCMRLGAQNTEIDFLAEYKPGIWLHTANPDYSLYRYNAFGTGLTFLKKTERSARLGFTLGYSYERMQFNYKNMYDFHVTQHDMNVARLGFVYMQQLPYGIRLGVFSDFALLFSSYHFTESYSAFYGHSTDPALSFSFRLSKDLPFIRNGRLRVYAGVQSPYLYRGYTNEAKTNILSGLAGISYTFEKQQSAEKKEKIARRNENRALRPRPSFYAGAGAGIYMLLHDDIEPVGYWNSIRLHSTRRPAFSLNMGYLQNHFYLTAEAMAFGLNYSENRSARDPRYFAWLPAYAKYNNTFSDVTTKYTQYHLSLVPNLAFGRKTMFYIGAGPALNLRVREYQHIAYTTRYADLDSANNIIATHAVSGETTDKKNYVDTQVFLVAQTGIQARINKAIGFRFGYAFMCAAEKSPDRVGMSFNAGIMLNLSALCKKTE